MRNFMLLFSVTTVIVVFGIASEDISEDINETNGSNYAVDFNMPELIINDGSGVINNQHTEKPYQEQP